LHSIRGYAELLELDSTDDDTRDAARRIRKGADRLSRIWEDVIDLLRGPAHGAEVHGASLGFDDLVRSSSEDVTDERRVRVHLSGSTPPADVTVPSELRRVVSHILCHVASNATNDVTASCAIRSSRSCVIAIAPVPDGLRADEDGVISLARRLLDRGGGALRLAGARLEIEIPLVESIT
jgi:hypothetical protein